LIVVEHCCAHRLACHRELLSACCLPHLSYSLADRMARWKVERMLAKKSLALLSACQPGYSHQRHHRRRRLPGQE